MPGQQICYLSATGTRARFAELSLSPVELMQAVIARCEAVEGAINAFTETWYDEALDTALAFEREFDAPPWRLDSRICGGD